MEFVALSKWQLLFLIAFCCPTSSVGQNLTSFLSSRIKVLHWKDRKVSLVIFYDCFIYIRWSFNKLFRQFIAYCAGAGDILIRYVHKKLSWLDLPLVVFQFSLLKVHVNFFRVLFFCCCCSKVKRLCLLTVILNFVVSLCNWIQLYVGMFTRDM